MDSYNQPTQPEYSSIVYTTQDISNIEGILPSDPIAPVNAEPVAVERSSIISAALEAAADDIIDIVPALLPVALPTDANDLSDDLQPLQSSELQPLDTITMTTPVLANPLDSVDEVQIETVAVMAEEIAEPTAVTEAEEIAIATEATDEVEQSTIADPISPTEDVQPEEVDQNDSKPDEDAANETTVFDEPPELIEGSTPADAVKRGEEIDQNQCRVCTSKDNLHNIFKYDHAKNLRICDLIMMLCSPLKISERDYLPKFVCEPCVVKLNAAHDLKLLVEQTDKDLRSKLTRSKKKRRGPTEFVIIDCADFSSESEDDKNKDDDDFQLSEEAISSEDDDDDDIDSDFSLDEKPKKRGSKAKAKSTKKSPKTKSTPAKRKADFQLTPIKRNRNDVLYIEAPEESNGGGRARGKRGRSDRTMLCPICRKPFKQQASLASHIAKHKEDEERTCAQCNKYFASRVDLRRHVQTAHVDVFACNRCKRTFTTKPRLDRHREKCLAEATTARRKPDVDNSMSSGKDLFKSVAPMTTTYWSDSFSD